MKKEQIAVLIEEWKALPPVHGCRGYRNDATKEDAVCECGADARDHLPSSENRGTAVHGR